VLDEGTNLVESGAILDEIGHVAHERQLCARSRHSKTDKARLLGPLVPHAAILGERQEQVIEYPHGNLSLDSCLSSDDAVRSGLVNPVG
jgi:hypothetical protein